MGLEKTYRKSLDANVERDGAKEIDWNNDDSYSYLFEPIEETEDIVSSSSTNKDSDVMIRGVLESEESEFDELFNAEDYGKIADKVLVTEKEDAEKIELDLEDLDVINHEMDALLNQEIDKLEGIF